MCEPRFSLQEDWALEDAVARNTVDGVVLWGRVAQHPQLTGRDASALCSRHAKIAPSSSLRSAELLDDWRLTDGMLCGRRQTGELVEMPADMVDVANGYARHLRVVYELGKPSADAARAWDNASWMPSIERAMAAVLRRVRAIVPLLAAALLASLIWSALSPSSSYYYVESSYSYHRTVGPDGHVTEDSKSSVYTRGNPKVLGNGGIDAIMMRGVGPW